MMETQNNFHCEIQIFYLDEHVIINIKRFILHLNLFFFY